ncbi:MAG: hypothetical protein JKY65_29005 [Planctomycetes bacterium]|nr:hypothetical protein [Planctomycetota bacterium]
MGHDHRAVNLSLIDEEYVGAAVGRDRGLEKAEQIDDAQPLHEAAADDQARVVVDQVDELEADRPLTVATFGQPNRGRRVDLPDLVWEVRLPEL